MIGIEAQPDCLHADCPIVARYWQQPADIVDCASDVLSPVWKTSGRPPSSILFEIVMTVSPLVGDELKQDLVGCLCE